MKNLLLVLLAFPLFLNAQIPVGYYNSAQGLTGDALKIALHNIIDNHTVVSYNNLHNAYVDTDKLASGKVWDIYSDVPNGTAAYYFTFGTDQCGNYAVEGDCYNREHTWPQSWFSSTSGPQSDLFHVMPTDGKVNGERDNFPYGNVNIANYTSSNGSKLGFSTDLGYSSVVFEPIDEYKGDVARNYFYMSTRYYSEDASWSSSSATTKSEILPWQLNVLLTWHHADPVSAKETARNNVIYSNYQHNRNPFIDNPQWADSIWSATVNNFISTVSLLEKEIGIDNAEKIFPNPTSSSIFLKIENYTKDYFVEVVDIDGRKINCELSNENGLLKINTDNVENGFYFVNIYYKNKIQNFNFVKI